MGCDLAHFPHCFNFTSKEFTSYATFIKSLLHFNNAFNVQFIYNDIRSRGNIYMHPPPRFCNWNHCMLLSLGKMTFNNLNYDLNYCYYYSYNYYYYNHYLLYFYHWLSKTIVWVETETSSETFVSKQKFLQFSDVGASKIKIWGTTWKCEKVALIVVRGPLVFPVGCIVPYTNC